MKKITVLCALLVFFTGYAVAENTVQEEAVQSLSTAQSFVENENYGKAVEEINYALTKINELAADLLLGYIPEPPPGYSLVNKQSQGSSGNVSIAGNASATAEYSYKDGAVININIAVGGMTGQMGSLAALGTMFAGMGGQNSGDGQFKQLRVNGYTGTQIYDAAQESGTLTFQVGSKISVTLEGQNIGSAEDLVSVAKAVDFQGLENSF